MDTFKRLTWYWRDNFFKENILPSLSPPWRWNCLEMHFQPEGISESLQAWESQGTLGYCTSPCVTFHHGIHSLNKMEIIMTGSSREKNIISCLILPGNIQLLVLVSFGAENKQPFLLCTERRAIPFSSAAAMMQEENMTYICQFRTTFYF